MLTLLATRRGLQSTQYPVYPVPSTQLRSPARASFCGSRPRTDGGKAAAAAAADGNENESRIGENTKCGTLSEGRKLVELETKVI